MSESGETVSKSGVLLRDTQSILVFQEPGPQCKETWLTGSCLVWVGVKKEKNVKKETWRSRSKSRVGNGLSQNFH